MARHGGKPLGEPHRGRAGHLGRDHRLVPVALRSLFAPERRELRRALAWAGGLALYGNVLNLLILRVPPRRRDAVGVAGPLVLTTAVLAWHRLVERGPLGDLGLHRRRWRGDLLWGALAGLLMGAPPLLFFRPPGGRREGVRFAEVDGIGRGALLRRLLLTTPILVAGAEELAFRGFLQGRLRRALPGRPVLPVVSAASPSPSGTWRSTCAPCGRRTSSPPGWPRCRWLSPPGSWPSSPGAWSSAPSTGGPGVWWGRSPPTGWWTP